MYKQVETQKKSSQQSVAKKVTQKQSNDESYSPFVDNRQESIVQRKLQDTIDNSSRMMQLKSLQNMMDNSPQTTQPAQLQPMEENYTSEVHQPVQMKGKVAVNDDAGLEREADVMGAKAIQTKLKDNQNKMQVIAGNNSGKLAQLHKTGVFDAGEGSKWHIEFNHIKFKNNGTVNFTNSMKKQEVIAKLRDSYNMTNKELRNLDVKTWIECTKWLKSQLG